MTLTPHDDSQPETSQNDSSSTGSSMVPTPEPTRSATQISSPRAIEPISPQKRPNVLYRFFHPLTPFPIMTRGVIVYALWNRPPSIPISLASLPPEIKLHGERFGPWYVTRFVWKPGSAT